MMELRNIVKYKQLVNVLDTIGLRENIKEQLDQLYTNLSTHPFNAKNLKEQISNNHLDILKILDGMSGNLNKFKEELNAEVQELEKPYYEMSKEIYKINIAQSSLEKMDRYVFKNVLFNESLGNLLKSRIAKYTTNVDPGLQLGPGYGEITNQLVSLNPLYLMDDSPEMLKEIKKWREPAYQRRLRYYIVDDTHVDPLHELPQNQLGIVIAVNWFNFKPLKIIRKYLESILRVLRPGGIIIFTYNNCDYPKAVDKVNEMYYCYTTSIKVKDVCIQLGYEIINSFDEGYDELDMGISWLEIQKPGTRSTIRLAETMGMIKQLGEN